MAEEYVSNPFLDPDQREDLYRQMDEEVVEIAKDISSWPVKRGGMRWGDKRKAQ